MPRASAELLFDPIGAYTMGAGSGATVGQVPKNAMGKPNSGILLLRECFDGGLPADGLLSWYEEHLSADFRASFAAGKVVLDKAAYLGVTADILKSFPDFTYTRESQMKYMDSPSIVAWTAVVRGTHTAAPYSPLPGVPAVAAQKPPIACQNDPERITAVFESGTGLTKIKSLTG